MISCSVGFSQGEYGVIVISLAFLLVRISATSWDVWRLELSAMNIRLINRIIIMLAIEFGSCYLKLKHEMMETQSIEMDENRSVLVWDQNLSVLFLQTLMNWSFSIWHRLSWIWTGSIQVGIHRLRGWFKSWNREERRQQQSYITNISKKCSIISSIKTAIISEIVPDLFPFIATFPVSENKWWNTFELSLCASR